MKNCEPAESGIMDLAMERIGYLKNRLLQLEEDMELFDQQF